MPVYFLSTGQDFEHSARVEGRIREAIPDLTRITRVEDAASARSDKFQDPVLNPIYMLLLGPTTDSDYFDRFIGAISHYHERIFFILISDDISATDYKRLVRTGKADWVSTDAAPREIIEIIAKRRPGVSSPSPSISARASPVAVAFVPSAGGVGNATLVSEIGVRIKTGKSSKDRRVCIVDLDFQTSHVCDYLDIEPHLQIHEISSNPERFDAHLCELFTTRHSSGLDVFAAPRSRFDIAGLNAVALDAVFDRIAARYDVILIDLPPMWFAWTSDILANSDGIIVTGINTIPGLRQIAEELAAIRSLRSNSGQTAVVINRYEATLTGGIARRKHVESVLRGERVFYVRNDAAGRAESINTGVPQVLGTSLRKTVREIGAVAAFCVELKSIRAGAA